MIKRTQIDSSVNDKPTFDNVSEQFQSTAAGPNVDMPIVGRHSAYNRRLLT